MHVRTCTYLQIRALIRLVAAATIRERRLFHSALAQVRLLFESGVYSREASIRSYTIFQNITVYRPSYICHVTHIGTVLTEHFILLLLKNLTIERQKNSVATAASATVDSGA